MTRISRWAARVIAIAAILFLSMFALDAFRPGTLWTEAAIEFAVHLLPSLALLVALVIAWRIEWLGGILFLFAGLSPFLLLSNPAAVNLMLGGPLLVAGLLFLASNRLRARREDRR
ncbi:hypothetical protein [Oricola sp.]|uniref:DUF7670 domain-containing protein n=1 Tax=Oricola sp. TaxID=1979950 RepID=UPI0025DEBC80|nr:hypothetical protein [Oricola sp.]MCI5077287.1 hypothetical protein [Oricola sp.]